MVVDVWFMRGMHYLIRSPYYFNLILFGKILWLAGQVWGYQQSRLLSLIHVPLKCTLTPGEQEKVFAKVSHYVRIALMVRSWFIKQPPTCLIRSIILCRILRDYGVDAKVNFGTRVKADVDPQGWRHSGHCWVTYGKPAESPDFPFVFQLP